MTARTRGEVQTAKAKSALAISEYIFHSMGLFLRTCLPYLFSKPVLQRDCLYPSLNPTNTGLGFGGLGCHKSKLSNNLLALAADMGITTTVAEAGHPVERTTHRMTKDRSRSVRLAGPVLSPSSARTSSVHSGERLGATVWSHLGP